MKETGFPSMRTGRSTRSGRRAATSRAVSSSLPLLALIALLPSLLSAQQDQTSELMRRHLDALGGAEAVRAVVTTVARGEMEIVGTGLKGTIESRSARPCLSSTEISLGFLKIREGYDGERIWMIDQNGRLQMRRDPGSIEYQRTICAIESWEYVLGGAGVSIEPDGRDSVNGDSCEAVRLVVEGGAPCRLLIDESTYLLRRMEIKASEGLILHTFDDYRGVGGIMYPFLQRMELPALGQRVEMRYTEVAPNAPVDPAVFVPPTPAGHDYRIESGRGFAAVPFEFRHGHLFVPVRVEGAANDLPFLLDSGASMTVIDSAVASDLGLPAGGLLPGAGAGGITSFRLIRVPGLRLGDIALSEQTAVAFPVAGLLRELDETKIGGILGYDFLSRFTVRLDYEGRVVTFFEPDSFAPNGGEIAVEAPLTRNIFAVPVVLDGSEEGSFLLDTGASSSMVQRSFASKAGVDADSLELEIAFRGAGGEQRAALCRFDTLSIGGIGIPGAVLAVVSGAAGIGALENVDGLIGNDVLERFTVTLDYRDQKVMLERNGRFAEPFFRDRSGLQIARRRDGGIVVVSVVPRSPAARAGLRPGDVMTKIGRTKTKRFRSLEDVSVLFEGAEGTVLRIEIERGREKRSITLTLGRYI